MASLSPSTTVPAHCNVDKFRKEVLAKQKQMSRHEYHKSDHDQYYASVTKKPQLYIQTFNDFTANANPGQNVLESGEVLYIVDVETLIVLLIYEAYKLDEWIQLNIAIKEVDWLEDFVHDFDDDLDENNCPAGSTAHVAYRNSNIKPATISRAQQDVSSNNENIQYCKLPYIHVEEKRLYVSGLSSTIRFLFKYCSTKSSNNPINPDNKKLFKSLLGFREACLQACSESSIWTRFCEIDMTLRMNVSLVISVLNSTGIKGVELTKSGLEPKEKVQATILIPMDLLRFEYHLMQPVRIHNFRKKLQYPEGVKLSKISRMMKELDLEKAKAERLDHTFAEGPELTLADLILFPSIQLSLRVFGQYVFEKYLPHVLIWSRKVSELTGMNTNNYEFNGLSQTILPSNADLPKQIIPRQSLYKSDPARYNPRLKHYTKPADIEESFTVFYSDGLNPMDYHKDNDVKQGVVDWSTVPDLVHPGIGGQLPVNRQERKVQQIESMVKMIQFIYEKEIEKRTNYESFSNNLRIVDFCSGGGHLGIFLAWFFPHSQVFLIENKEESLGRAEVRVASLKLSNVTFFQSNLTRFIGPFEIGCALHACGSATDLALSKCHDQRASFIVSPCCYGGIKDNPTIKYPRSTAFQMAVTCGGAAKKYNWKDFYGILAHTADQTQVDDTNTLLEQGKLAMRLIDTDRCLRFIEKAISQQDGVHGYQTWLNLMEPQTASPKNHILVGFCHEVGRES